MPFPKYAVSAFKGLFVYFQEETQDSWKPEGVWGEWDYSDGCMQRQAGPSLLEPWSCSVSEPGPHHSPHSPTNLHAHTGSSDCEYTNVLLGCNGVHESTLLTAEQVFQLDALSIMVWAGLPQGLPFPFFGNYHWNINIAVWVNAVIMQSARGSRQLVVGSGCCFLKIKKGRPLKHVSFHLEL